MCRGSCSARAADEFLRTCECQFRGDLDGRFQRPVDRAEIGKNAMHSLGRLLMLGTRLQAQNYVNAPDDQHSILGLHFTRRIRRQFPGRGINLTRLQRASKGPGESACRRRDDIVERSGMGFEDIGGHFVVLRHGAVYSEENGGRLRGQPGTPKRSLYALDPHPRHVRYIFHGDHDNARRRSLCNP